MNKTFEYTPQQAIERVADGHAIYKPEAAKAICEALDVPYSTTVERAFFSDWNNPKGAHMSPGNEGMIAVDALALGRYITEQLGLEVESYIGRGFQGRAYARAITDYRKENANA